MPYGFGARGTAAVTGRAGTFASGTARVILGAADGAAKGTAAVDRALINASLLRQRWGSADVRINGESMTRLVGTVTLDESDASQVPSASFELLTSRLARHNAATLTWGERPCTVDFLTGGAGAKQTWRSFEGHIESSDNSGAYVPRGSIRAVGKAAEWANRLGCVRLGAFQGKRRGGILKALADSVGVTIATPGIESLGRLVNRPVELNGISVPEYAARIADLEGWKYRWTAAGELEVITEDEWLHGAPIFDFTTDTYYSVKETTPSRPTTVWVLSGVYIPAELVDGAQKTDVSTVYGTDEAGLPWKTETSVTTQGGVEINREVKEWRTVETDGQTYKLPATLQITKRTIIASTWNVALFPDGKYHYTTALARRITAVYELSGVPSSAGYAWVGGGNWTSPRAALILTSTVEEALNYFPADDALKHRRCTLRSRTIAEFRNYSPKTTLMGFVYADGTHRVDASYSWREVAEVDETYDDERDQTPAYINRHERTLQYVFAPGATEETLREVERKEETWVDAGNGRYIHRLLTLDMQAAFVGTPTWQEPSPPEIITGPLPGPPVGSVNTAQIQQTTAVYSIDGSTRYPFAASKKSETIEALEDPEELPLLGTRRVREDLADKLEIRSRIIPGLRVNDPIRVTDPARSLSLRRGWVTNIQRIQEVVNGSGRQTTKIKLVPEEP